MNPPERRRKPAVMICTAVLGALLLLSAALNAYCLLSPSDSYLQSTEQIYVMEAGILYNNLTLAPGKVHDINYEFGLPAYDELLERYGVSRTAGSGTELERALRLMDEYAPRLTHQSRFTAPIEISALPLLEYSLDNPKQGINCRCKAQILNEMCLALGIPSRKVWLMPYSPYDTDCHVVNEIWDSTLGKWVMLDITNNEYWIDEKGTPLSILEIREKGALQQFCTPVSPGEAITNPHALREKHMGSFVYIMKNLAYMEYCAEYTVGEAYPIYRLAPESLADPDFPSLSPEAVQRPPV